MTGNNEYLANGHFGFGNVIQFLKEGNIGEIPFF